MSEDTTASMLATLDPGTGAGAKPNTPQREAAEIAWLDAVAAEFDAKAHAYQTRRLAFELDDSLDDGARALLMDCAHRNAVLAAAEATRFRDMARARRGNTPAGEPMAVITLVITRERIVQTASLIMGLPQTARVEWNRAERGSGWHSRNSCWEDEALAERLGLELCEYMDALRLPDRVADMLPRPASADVIRAAQADIREALHERA